MNKTITAIACAMALSTYAAYEEEPAIDTNATVLVNALISETIKVIQDEGWTAEDVADAIRSLRGLYLRDNATKEGRYRWHGKVTYSGIDTNAMVLTTIHEDGETFQDPAKVITPLDAVRAANAKLPPPVMTNGIPARLAAARLRQRENSTTTNEVTIVVSPSTDD